MRSARQPGSALKPFLYASALDLGWSPATILRDVPTEESIGSGLHSFRNYSHSYYGDISLREALGNSLNIPAIETIDFVTPERYLRKLHALGFDMLEGSADYYRDGLALGSAEVTLLSMVQAYSALAERGMLRPLTPSMQVQETRKPQRVYSDEAASLIGNILSDPYARRREFGAGSVLNLPVQTAVKTGTSTDYRDAWVMGYNARYTVGVWMGNLDGQPMDGITGSVGPALVLRAVFNSLAAHDTPRPLYLSPKLVAKQICTTIGAEPDAANCFPRTEYFIAGTEEQPVVRARPAKAFTVIRPVEGLHIAYDPRRPAELQAFEFSVHKTDADSTLVWTLNNEVIATTVENTYLWPVTRGAYSLTVSETLPDGTKTDSPVIHFLVK